MTAAFASAEMPTRTSRCAIDTPEPMRVALPDGLCEQGRFDVGDCALHYRHWRPTGTASRAVFLFHRGHEHGGRLADTVAELGLSDAHVIAWDARGHGQSPGRRGFAPDGFATLVRDMDRFVRGMAEHMGLPLEQCFVVAHSVAAVVASTWVLDHGPRLGGLALLTPAFRVRLYVPGALTGLRLLNRLRPQAQISSYVRGKLLSHDPQAAADYDNDPAVCKAISNRILVEMAAAAERVVADAAGMRVPLFMAQAGSDWVVDNRVQDRFFATCGSSLKRRCDLPGAYHAVLQESDEHRRGLIAQLRDFLAKDCREIEDPRLNQGDPASWRAHADASAPLGWWRPLRWWYGLQRLALAGPGRLAKGIRIGWRHGFDSGSSLDHIYRNRAQGWSPIGRAIDRGYLDAIGWQGIRLRRKHMTAALGQACDALAAQGKTVHLVDVAAGPGRYVCEFMAANPNRITHARLRDRDPAGIAEGKALAHELGLANVINEAGDAFAKHHLAECEPTPSLAVVSGLYELFPDNGPIRQSLSGIAEALASGDYLIYTNQPRHPQLAMIARVLPNRDGAAWAMRCRPQAEMEGLVRAAGFNTEATWSDPWGIFTVSLARKQ